jgi:hypothetical protein
MTNDRAFLSELKELYGYEPTFHDGHVIGINFDLMAGLFTLTVYYYDLSDGGTGDAKWDNEIHTIITIAWSGFTKLHMEMTSNWIDHAEWLIAENGTTFRWIDQDYGTWSEITTLHPPAISWEYPSEKFRYQGRDLDDVSLLLTARGL